MKRMLIAALGCSLIAGCKCSSEPERPAPAAPVAAAEDPLAIDEGIVIKYLGLIKDSIEPYRTALEDWKATAGPAREGEQADAVQRFAEAKEIQQKYKIATEELRERTGLTPELVEKVKHLVAEVSRSKEQFAKSGGERALAEAVQQFEALPESSRKGSDPERAMARLKALNEAAELRSQYGATALAAVVGYWDQIHEAEAVKARLTEEMIGK